MQLHPPFFWSYLKRLTAAIRFPHVRYASHGYDGLMLPVDNRDLWSYILYFTLMPKVIPGLNLWKE